MESFPNMNLEDASSHDLSHGGDLGRHQGRREKRKEKEEEEGDADLAIQ